MFYGRVDGVSVDDDVFINNIRDNAISYNWRLSHNYATNYYFYINLYPYNDTSTGSYLDVYFSP